MLGYICRHRINKWFYLFISFYFNKYYHIKNKYTNILLEITSLEDYHRNWTLLLLLLLKSYNFIGKSTQLNSKKTNQLYILF